MKNFCKGLFLSLSVVSCAYASPFEDAPTSCPSVTAIDAIGVDQALNLRGSDWIAYHYPENYGTDQQWGFFFLVGDVKNKQVAIRLANRKIKVLGLQSGPEYNDEVGGWVCYYLGRGKKANVGFTMTPPPSFVTAKVRALFQASR